MADMTIADEMMRRKLDPRFDLEKSIEWYNNLAAKWRAYPPPTEADAEQWEVDMRKAADKIESIYAKYPALRHQRRGSNTALSAICASSLSTALSERFARLRTPR